MVLRLLHTAASLYCTSSETGSYVSLQSYVLDANCQFRNLYKEAAVCNIHKPLKLYTLFI